MNRVKKNAKKGFTLIEIIVVLVIIAILAAATVPSMIGFIEEANGKAYASDARVGLVAAQAVATQLIAKGTVASTIDMVVVASDTSFETMVKDIPGGTTCFEKLEVDANGRVTKIVYQSQDNKYKVTIENGETKVERVG